jgi:hypothetical protein
MSTLTIGNRRILYAAIESVAAVEPERGEWQWRMEVRTVSGAVYYRPVDNEEQARRGADHLIETINLWDAL